MIRLGLRLTLRGGRAAAGWLGVTAAAVAVGVGLLLVTLAAINGVDAQNARYAWLNSGVPGASSDQAKPSPDPLWGTVRTDYYDGEPITRVDVAATGPRSPVPPGIPALPAPDEFYVSPALSSLLEARPDAELADRYPGDQVGTIETAALPAPDSLIVIVGRSAEEVSRVPGATQVTSIASTVPSDCSGCPAGFDADSISLILSVTAAALLVPILILIGTATRLSAARREQRFAAMRLVGATPGQVSVLSAVEALVAGLAGTAAGFALFALLRVPLASIPFTGEPFFRADLSLTPVDVLLVAVGVPATAALVAWISMRRVRMSPLGVSRRVTPPAPRAWRLIPLVVGVGELAYFVGRRPEQTTGQIWAYLTGILLMMVGLVIAGPWLTMVGSRVLAGRANAPSTLIAARRLADDPKGGFRAISGLVLALFVTSTAVGVMTTMVAERGLPSGEAANRTLTIDFGRADEHPVIPESMVAELGSGPGVQGVAVIHQNPLGTTVPVDDWHLAAGLVDCEEFAGVSGFGSCAPGAEVASVPIYLDVLGGSSAAALATTVWETAAISADELAGIPAEAIVVATTGSTSVIEQARTALAAAFPDTRLPATVAEQRVSFGGGKELAAYQQLANVVVLASLCIAGCSLAVSVVGGLHDRKRAFSLLRLAGVQLGVLRRTVVLETVVPLLTVAVIATASGFLAAALFLQSQMGYALQPPGTAYAIAVVAGLAASLAVVGCTLPLLGRLTGPETARNE
jgi:hypothetical protein